MVLGFHGWCMDHHHGIFSPLSSLRYGAVEDEPDCIFTGTSYTRQYPWHPWYQFSLSGWSSLISLAPGLVSGKSMDENQREGHFAR